MDVDNFYSLVIKVKKHKDNNNVEILFSNNSTFFLRNISINSSESIMRHFAPEFASVYDWSEGRLLCDLDNLFPKIVIEKIPPLERVLIKRNIPYDEINKYTGKIDQPKDGMWVVNMCVDSEESPWAVAKVYRVKGRVNLLS